MEHQVSTIIEYVHDLVGIGLIMGLTMLSANLWRGLSGKRRSRKIGQVLVVVLSFALALGLVVPRGLVELRLFVSIVLLAWVFIFRRRHNDPDLVNRMVATGVIFAFEVIGNLSSLVFQIPTGVRVGLVVVGMGLIATGAYLAMAARRLKKRYGGLAIAGSPDLASGDKLIRRGVYGLVRHPVYAGMLLMFGGIGLCLSSPFALAAEFVLVFPYLHAQACREEKVEGYALYATQVPDRYLPIRLGIRLFRGVPRTTREATMEERGNT